jgi:3-oxoadipate enol-lactonase
MQHVAVSNGMLNVYAQGKGTPLLFVHGFPLNHGMWHLQVAAFSKKARVLVPDLRGFGESTVTAGTVTMEEMADDLHGVMHGVWVDQPVVFCGLSMGGYVAWQFFRKYRSQLRALILCDTRATADTPRGWPDATSWPRR